MLELTVETFAFVSILRFNPNPPPFSWNARGMAERKTPSNSRHSHRVFQTTSMRRVSKFIYITTHPSKNEAHISLHSDNASSHGTPLPLRTSMIQKQVSLIMSVLGPPKQTFILFFHHIMLEVKASWPKLDNRFLLGLLIHLPNSLILLNSS